MLLPLLTTVLVLISSAILSSPVTEHGCRLPCDVQNHQGFPITFGMLAVFMFAGLLCTYFVSEAVWTALRHTACIPYI